MNRDDLIERLRGLLESGVDLRDLCHTRPECSDFLLVEKYLELKDQFEQVKKVVYQVEHSTYVNAERERAMRNGKG